MQLHPQYYYQQLPPQERAAYHGVLTCLQALAPSARIPGRAKAGCCARPPSRYFLAFYFTIVRAQCKAENGNSL